MARHLRCDRDEAVAIAERAQLRDLDHVGGRDAIAVEVHDDGHRRAPRVRRRAAVGCSHPSHHRPSGTGWSCRTSAAVSPGTQTSCSTGTGNDVVVVAGSSSCRRGRSPAHRDAERGHDGAHRRPAPRARPGAEGRVRLSWPAVIAPFPVDGHRMISAMVPAELRADSPRQRRKMPGVTEILMVVRRSPDSALRRRGGRPAGAVW